MKGSKDVYAWEEYACALALRSDHATLRAPLGTAPPPAAAHGVETATAGPHAEEDAAAEPPTLTRSFATPSRPSAPSCPEHSAGLGRVPIIREYSALAVGSQS